MSSDFSLVYEYEYGYEYEYEYESEYYESRSKGDNIKLTDSFLTSI